MLTFISKVDPDIFEFLQIPRAPRNNLFGTLLIVIKVDTLVKVDIRWCNGTDASNRKTQWCS